MRITFHLDGTGVHFRPWEPIHLDGILAWVLAPRQGYRHLTRDEVPADIELPLLKQRIGETWVWRASALFPEGETGESVWYWRKRFRRHRADLTTGSPNLQMGTYRDWQTPVPFLLCHRLVAYASGDAHEVRRLLREVRYLGKKRAHGHGRIVRMDVEPWPEDWSLSREGRAMRWLPDQDGLRIVRPRPPYWHSHGAIPCCEVGDPTTIR